MVYVLDVNGQPIMPTNRHGKVKHLLRDKQAKIVKRCPFTIQLLYKSTTYTQPITLGIDAGSKTIGVSATTDTKELYASNVMLRNDIVNLLSTRREQRTSRRSRKTRYRAPRFDNRVSTKQKGWVAPSIEHKIQTHLTVCKQILNILPITKIIVETASFDIQKIKAIKSGSKIPTGTEYQEGDMLDFWNVREYVLFRDGHKCQNPKCKHGKILNVHHIESRKKGGNAPSNLITLCEECHKLYHAGKLKIKFKRGTSFRDAAFMGIMRWTFYNRLKELYMPLGIDVSMTYGYITKNIRITHNLQKEHYIDARCITGNPDVIPVDSVYYIKKVRNHNRQIHKCTINKGGTRKLNKAPKYVFGFQLFDKIKYKDTECFIFGRRSSGSFDIRLLDGTKVHAGISYKKLELKEKRKTYLIEKKELCKV